MIECQREGWTHIFLCASAQSTFRGQAVPVFADDLQNLVGRGSCVLGLEPAIWRDLKSKIEGDRCVILVNTEGQRISFRDRVYIVQGGEMPAIPLQEEAMVSHMVVGIGHGHAEHVPLPQFDQFSLGGSSVGLGDRHQSKLSGAARG